MDTLSKELVERGFTILPDVIDAQECRQIVSDIDQALASRPEDAIESGKGGVVGGRNLIDQ